MSHLPQPRSAPSLKRIATAVVAIPLLFLLLWRGDLLLFLAVASLLGAVGSSECAALLESAGLDSYRSVGILLTVSVIISLGLPAAPPGGVLALLLILPLSIALLRESPAKNVPAILGATLLSPILVGVPLGFLARIRSLSAEHEADGDLVLLLFLATWGSDSLAYFVGKSVGRHRFAPVLSPKKTWEGAAGGVVGALLGAWLGTFIARSPIPLRAALPVGVIVAILGPIGDLAESLLKRSASVKDSGGLFPGHGGLLDRIDSLIFTAPVLYYYYRLAYLSQTLG